MASVKIAISIDSDTLERVDDLVSHKLFSSRSRAIEQALTEKLARLERTRLAAECAKLDPRFEQAFAEEGLNGDLAS